MNAIKNIYAVLALIALCLSSCEMKNELEGKYNLKNDEGLLTLDLVNKTQATPTTKAESTSLTDELDVNTYMSEPYITANYSSYNGMNGNNINDIYVDEEERIWLANYPTGITVRNNRYGSYDLIRHSLGNSRSLVNDQVHDVLEDSDGDLWFATSNGISIYQTDTKEWRSFFSSFDPVPDDENHIFLALCEVSPGVIWAGGFTSGIYKIEKKKGFKISYLSPAAIAGVRPDQYIFDIKKRLGR